MYFNHVDDDLQDQWIERRFWEAVEVGLNYVMHNTYIHVHDYEIVNYNSPNIRDDLERRIKERFRSRLYAAVQYSADNIMKKYDIGVWSSEKPGEAEIIFGVDFGPIEYETFGDGSYKYDKYGGVIRKPLHKCKKFKLIRRWHKPAEKKMWEELC